MLETTILERIVIDPNILVGKPIIKGTRLSVSHILKLFANGETIEDILKEYPGLDNEDIRACFLFANQTLENSLYYPRVA
jgi:uncharacterized protein (DUF433 family)